MHLIDLYEKMVTVRTFELAVSELWKQGLIPGEMHLGTGEEAMAAGVASQLGPEDALALEHRATPMLLLRGVDPVALLREMMGKEDGLCRGRGGHMHLYSREHLAASSGIVGAAGPAAVGFALAARALRPRSVAVAFFGDGAANQGVLHETMNLASIWKLPVVFVCENNGWAESTPGSYAHSITDLADRAVGYSMPGVVVDAADPQAVWSAAGAAISRARKGQGPSFLEAKVPRMVGHYLGDPEGYRSADDRRSAVSRDPLHAFRNRLLVDDAITASHVEALESQIRTELDQGIARATQAPWPRPEDVATFVYAGDGSDHA